MKFNKPSLKEIEIENIETKKEILAICNNLLNIITNKINYAIKNNNIMTEKDKEHFLLLNKNTLDQLYDCEKVILMLVDKHEDTDKLIELLDNTNCKALYEVFY